MDANDERAVGRRRHPRVPLRLPVRLSTIDSEVDPVTQRPCFRISEETCVNVSRGGLFLVTEDPLAAGRRVLVEVDLPGADPVEAVGRVAWTRLHVDTDASLVRTGLGVEFIGGEPDQLARLESHLARVAGPAAGPSQTRVPARRAPGAIVGGGA